MNINGKQECIGSFGEKYGACFYLMDRASRAVQCKGCIISFFQMLIQAEKCTGSSPGAGTSYSSVAEFMEKTGYDFTIAAPAGQDINFFSPVFFHPGAADYKNISMPEGKNNSFSRVPGFFENIGIVIFNGKSGRPDFKQKISEINADFFEEEILEFFLPSRFFFLFRQGTTSGKYAKGEGESVGLRDESGHFFIPTVFLFHPR